MFIYSDAYTFLMPVLARTRNKLSILSILGVILIFSVLLSPNIISPVGVVKATFGASAFSPTELDKINLYDVTNNNLAHFDYNSSINSIYQDYMYIGEIIDHISISAKIYPAMDAYLTQNQTFSDFGNWTRVRGILTEPSGISVQLLHPLFVGYTDNSTYYMVWYNFSSINYQINIAGTYHLEIYWEFYFGAI